MKIILFDLGDTLEHEGALLPGASEMLAAVSSLRDSRGEPVRLALLSDFHLAGTPAEIPALRESYLTILEQLGIRSFFEPTDESVTLSTDLGVYKTDERLFKAALEKFGGTCLGDMLFITENLAHVNAARELGLRAVHLRGPNGDTGEIETLADFIAVAAGHAADLE